MLTPTFEITHIGLNCGARQVAYVARKFLALKTSGQGVNISLLQLRVRAARCLKKCAEQGRSLLHRSVEVTLRSICDDRASVVRQDIVVHVSTRRCRRRRDGSPFRQSITAPRHVF